MIDRYLAERALIDRPVTVNGARQSLRKLTMWLAETRPAVETLAELARTDLLDFLQLLPNQRKTNQNPGAELSLSYRRSLTWRIQAFFGHVCQAAWDDVPARPPISAADVPPHHQARPPLDPRARTRTADGADSRARMPYQRCVLLVARWSGARRAEIRKLHLDCLDTYADGTHRIRLAAVKSRKERSVPIHFEAAEAIETLAALRRRQSDRGIYDPELGRPVRYLFLRSGVCS